MCRANLKVALLLLLHFDANMSSSTVMLVSVTQTRILCHYDTRRWGGQGMGRTRAIREWSQGC